MTLLVVTNSFQEYFSRYSYIGIYVWFITVDQIAPIPEEITLIIVGYLVMHSSLNPFLAGAFSIAAFITVDTVYYYLTKTGNHFIKKMTTKSESPFVKSYRKKMKNHTLKSLIILCFIPRLRLFAPVYMAILKIPYKRFILYDLIGLSIFTTVYISLGAIFHKSLSPLLEETKTVGHIIFISAMVVMTILSIFFFRKFRK